MTDNLNGPEWLADYLGIPLASVYQMNSKGSGPRRIKVGRHVRYRKVDVDSWLDQHVVDGAASR
ncbi:MAG: helix-turn-helix transcriptional regulator [Aeromicrobium sp.]